MALKNHSIYRLALGFCVSLSHKITTATIPSCVHFLFPTEHCCGQDCCCLVTRLCPTFETAWTVACQAPLSTGFPRQESWGGLPFPLPRDLPVLEMEPVSPSLASRFFTTEPPGKPSGQSQTYERMDSVVKEDLRCMDNASSNSPL